MSTSQPNHAQSSRGLTRGWEIAIDIAAAIGFWALTFFNNFPPLVAYGVPVVFLLIAIPLAIRRNKSRASDARSPK
ncbi:hypothetical protein [Microbacterium natoriense]